MTFQNIITDKIYPDLKYTYGKYFYYAVQPLETETLLYYVPLSISSLLFLIDSMPINSKIEGGLTNWITPSDFTKVVQIDLLTKNDPILYLRTSYDPWYTDTAESLLISERPLTIKQIKQTLHKLVAFANKLLSPNHPLGGLSEKEIENLPFTWSLLLHNFAPPKGSNPIITNVPLFAIAAYLLGFTVYYKDIELANSLWRIKGYNWQGTFIPNEQLVNRQPLYKRE